MDYRAIAHAVPVLQGAFDDDADDLHVAMGVGAETLSGCHAIVVDHTQVAKTHVLGVVVASERKTVPAGKPAEVGVAALVGLPDLYP